MRMKFKRFTVETLEDRNLMSVWGMAWPNANHLTASFAPDGADVNGAPSALFQSLGQSAAWQLEALRALQTWAVHANINIGLVADGGQALGAAGLLQSDARFGDIRLAARPMGDDPLDKQHLAVGTPYTPLAGTEAGDIVLNSGQSIGSTYDLFTVVLHEAGHVFGFADDPTDTTSANYFGYLGPRPGLSDADIAMLQDLYGARAADAYDAAADNGSLDTATPLMLPNVAGDITTNGDADFYRFEVPTHAGATMTVRVQTSGLSLLVPRLSVYDADHQLVATTTAVDALHGDVAITIDNIVHGSVYYFKVEGAVDNVFGIGGYRLQVDSGAVAQMEIAALDALLSGSVAGVAQNAVTQSAATPLDQAAYATQASGGYAVTAALDNASAQHFYSVTAPSQGSAALVLTVTAGQGSALNPKITVSDANGTPVNVQILSNDSSSYVVQIVNPVAGATYHVAVGADAAATGDAATGTYLLSANFRDTAIVLDALMDGAFTGASRQALYNIDSTEFQLYHFVLSVDAGTATDVAVQLNLYDENNNVVLTVICQNGQTTSANVALTKSIYSARVTATSLCETPLPTVVYKLKGTNLSDPMDPVPVNPNDPTLPAPVLPPLIVTQVPPPAPPAPPPGDPIVPPPTYPTSAPTTTATSPTTSTTTTASDSTAPATSPTTTTGTTTPPPTAAAAPTTTPTPTTSTTTATTTTTDNPPTI